jgi:hypothetical protein
MIVVSMISYLIYLFFAIRNHQVLILVIILMNILVSNYDFDACLINDEVMIKKVNILI